MKKLKKIIIIMTLLIFSISDINGFACTIFTEYDDNLILVGNNEDWIYSYDSTYWIVPTKEDEYGGIYFGIASYVQGGMNEKGLFYDGATCPTSEIPYDFNKEELGLNMGEVILSKCATVKEVISFLENYNYPTGFSDHLMFADSSGDAAVVEWVENQMRVIKSEDNKLIATNFYLSNRDIGGYPCIRYSEVEEKLSKPHTLDVEYFTDVLSATAQDWGDGGTKYSNIYDLKSLTVYIYEKSDFSNVAVINLRSELESPTLNSKNIMQNISSLDYKSTESILMGENQIDSQMSEDIQSDIKAIEQNKSNSIQSSDNDLPDEDLYLELTIFIFIGVSTLVVILFLFYRKRKNR